MLTRARLRNALHSVAAWLDRHLMGITVVTLVAAFFFIFFAHRMIVTIPAGYRGVLWQRIGGTNLSRTYGEGLHLVWPWNVLVPYNVRYQTDTRDYSVVDDRGLRFTIRLSTRYRPNARTLPHLHQSVGPTYLDVVIVPEVSSHVRAVVATMPAEDVYAKLRGAIERSMLDRVRREIILEFPGAGSPTDLIYVEDVLLQQVTLPPLVAATIEEKARQYHMLEEWQFRKAREDIEAERKRIEGRGIRNFQDEAGRLTEEYLRLRGIEAILKLAESANAKTIIIGSGPQGVPIILGNETIRPAPGPAGTPRVGPPGAALPSTPSRDDARSDAAPAPTVAPETPASSPAPAAAPGAPVAKAAPAAGQGWLGGLVNRLSWLVGK